MPFVVPLTPSTPHYRVSTTLDGIQYTLDVRWNARAESWYLDIFAEDGAPVRRGIRIALGTNLGGRSADPDFPPGFLFAADLTGQSGEAALDDLGARVPVYFIPLSETEGFTV